jgi:hypothetical protein
VCVSSLEVTGSNPEGGTVCIPPQILADKSLHEGGPLPHKQGGLIHQFGVWLGRDLENRLLLLLLYTHSILLLLLLLYTHSILLLLLLLYTHSILLLLYTHTLFYYYFCIKLKIGLTLHGTNKWDGCYNLFNIGL